MHIRLPAPSRPRSSGSNKTRGPDPSVIDLLVPADDPRWQEIEDCLRDQGDRPAKGRFRYRASAGGSVRHRHAKGTIHARHGDETRDTDHPASEVRGGSGEVPG